jgi:regulatory protein
VSAYSDALRMLARREHSVAEVRSRLVDREHTPEDIDAAIERLLESRALDDRRVARAYARTALTVKGRGRLRVQRELQVMGIAREIAGEAIADVFGDVDERALIEKAIQKKLRGGKKLVTMQERARVYQFLMRQGFTPAAVSVAMRRFGSTRDE